MTDASLHDASGVEHGAFLLRLTDAVAQRDHDVLPTLRTAGVEHLGNDGLVDALAVAAGFNGITRVADATGIPLDDHMAERSNDFRTAVGIEQFRVNKARERWEI